MKVGQAAIKKQPTNCIVDKRGKTVWHVCPNVVKSNAGVS